MLLFFQLLAYHMAVAAGENPDTPVTSPSPSPWTETPEVQIPDHRQKKDENGHSDEDREDDLHHAQGLLP